MDIEGTRIAIAENAASELRVMNESGYSAESAAELGARLEESWQESMETGKVVRRAVNGGVELTRAIVTHEDADLEPAQVRGAISVLVSERSSAAVTGMAERTLDTIAAQTAAAIARGRAMQERERSGRMRVTGDVAAGIARELRGSLVALSSAIQLVRFRAREDPVMEKNIGRILREVEQLLKLREEELALLRSSHSFKLTAPLRWLRRRLSGEAGPASALDAALLRDGPIPPAIQGFPVSMVKRDPPARLNDSHRPLRLDDALQPLISMDVVDGALDERVSPFDIRYHGGHPQPVRIATVACPEFRQELSFDAAVLPLHSERWKEQLDVQHVDLVLLDGAWDPEGGWGAGFGSSPESQRRVQPLLEHCRRHSVPVVLWAREDAGVLVRLQWLFPLVSRIYAIDDAGFGRLRREFPELKVGLLPVAVQPALYNPVRSYSLKECGVALANTALFDGWWALSTGLSDDRVLAALGDRLRVVDSDGDYSWARLQDNPRHAPLS